MTDPKAVEAVARAIALQAIPGVRWHDLDFYPNQQSDFRRQARAAIKTIQTDPEVRERVCKVIEGYMRLEVARACVRCTPASCQCMAITHAALSSLGGDDA